MTIPTTISGIIRHEGHRDIVMMMVMMMNAGKGYVMMMIMMRIGMSVSPDGYGEARELVWGFQDGLCREAHASVL